MTSFKSKSIRVKTLLVCHDWEIIRLQKWSYDDHINRVMPNILHVSVDIHISFIPTIYVTNPRGRPPASIGQLVLRSAPQGFPSLGCCKEEEPGFIKRLATNESLAGNVKDKCFTHDHMSWYNFDMKFKMFLLLITSLMFLSCTDIFFVKRIYSDKFLDNFKNLDF